MQSTRFKVVTDMDKNRYKQQFYDDHYERIHLAVPKGMKEIIKTLASEKGMSINAYLQDLVNKDQEGMFDTMQIADKNREQIAGIQGNMHDGYDVIFKDGHQIHCRTKKDVRAGIIEYCKGKEEQHE
jgi:phosphoglucomutase